jgi:hypothetical protein
MYITTRSTGDGTLYDVQRLRARNRCGEAVDGTDAIEKAYQFVLAHVGATLNIDDIKKIKTNAKTRCPSELRAICTDLTKGADAALKQDASLGIK